MTELKEGWGGYSKKYEEYVRKTGKVIPAMEILRQKLIADYNQNEKKRCWNNVKESLLALRENRAHKR